MDINTGFVFAKLICLFVCTQIAVNDYMLTWEMENKPSKLKWSLWKIQQASTQFTLDIHSLRIGMLSYGLLFGFPIKPLRYGWTLQP